MTKFYQLKIHCKFTQEIPRMLTLRFILKFVLGPTAGLLAELVSLLLVLLLVRVIVVQFLPLLGSSFVPMVLVLLVKS